MRHGPVGPKVWLALSIIAIYKEDCAVEYIGKHVLVPHDSWGIGDWQIIVDRHRPSWGGTSGNKHVSVPEYLETWGFDQEDWKRALNVPAFVQVTLARHVLHVGAHLALWAMQRPADAKHGAHVLVKGATRDSRVLELLASHDIEGGRPFITRDMALEVRERALLVLYSRLAAVLGSTYVPPASEVDQGQGLQPHMRAFCRIMTKVFERQQFETDLARRVIPVMDVVLPIQLPPLGFARSWPTKFMRVTLTAQLPTVTGYRQIGWQRVHIEASSVEPAGEHEWDPRLDLTGRLMARRWNDFESRFRMYEEFDQVICPERFLMHYLGAELFGWQRFIHRRSRPEAELSGECIDLEAFWWDLVRALARVTDLSCGSSSEPMRPMNVRQCWADEMRAAITLPFDIEGKSHLLHGATGGLGFKLDTTGHDKLSREPAYDIQGLPDRVADRLDVIYAMFYNWHHGRNIPLVAFEGAAYLLLRMAGREDSDAHPSMLTYMFHRGRIQIQIIEPANGPKCFCVDPTRSEWVQRIAQMEAQPPQPVIVG